jgi:2'-5' RNA ligase
MKKFKEYLKEKKIEPKNPDEYKAWLYSDLNQPEVLKNHEWLVKTYKGMAIDGEDSIENHVHITIFYGLPDSVLESDYFMELIEEFKNKDVTLKGTGFGMFNKCDDGKFDVVKIDCESKELTELHNKIRNNFDHNNTFPEYKPHITAVYKKCGHNVKMNIDKWFKPFEIKIDNYMFGKTDKSKVKL